MSAVLDELVAMSRYLGDPERPYVILGEGNTSARIDEDSFYVKASGTTLEGCSGGDFLPVSISKVIAILDDPKATDDDVDKVLRAAVLDPGEKRKPSVETMLHAILLQYPEYAFAAHSHPVLTNAILCSVNAEEAMAGRTCPDHIVVMGNKSVWVPYVDPGLVLAREVRDRVRRFIDEEGELPRAIMLQNHGSIAMAENGKKTIAITRMTEKASQIVLGSYAMGGPHFMDAKNVDRIHTRPDEAYRQKVIEQ